MTSHALDVHSTLADQRLQEQHLRGCILVNTCRIAQLSLLQVSVLQAERLSAQLQSKLTITS